MPHSERVYFFPDHLFNKDPEAEKNAPPFIRTLHIPFYDAQHLFQAISDTRGLITKQKELNEQPPFSFLNGGKTGDVYRLKMGESDLALKIMFGSQLPRELIEIFHDLIGPSLPDREFRQYRLVETSGLTPRLGIFVNIAGSAIGHHIFPEYIDQPNFILSHKGQIIGFATPMLSGKPFSLGKLPANLQFPLEQVQQSLAVAGVDLDTALEAENGIILSDNRIKIIDLRLTDKRILETDADEVFTRLDQSRAHQ